jgi:hypothetical protein
MNLAPFARAPRIFLAAIVCAAGLGGAYAISASAADPQAEISMAPNPMTFDNVGVGGTSDQVLKVYSVGNIPLTISSVTNTGRDQGDFAITSDGCTGHSLAPTAFCSVGVRFKPTRPGTRVSNIRVAGNACTKFAVIAGGGTTVLPSTARTAAACDVSTVTVTTPGASTTTSTSTTTTTQTSSGSVGAASNNIALSSTCSSRRAVTLHLRQPKHAYYKTVAVRVAGKLVKTLKGSKDKKIATTVSLKGLPLRRVAVSITAKASNGKTYKRTQHFVTCVAKK